MAFLGKEEHRSMYVIVVDEKIFWIFYDGGLLDR